MTHDDLCAIAVKWLLRPLSANGPNCKVAFKEVADVGARERADAWGTGWGYNARSVLVEVKMSRSDFFADAKKPHRQPGGGGLGDYRYYMCPEGVIQVADLPVNWGLLWVNSRGHVKVVTGHLIPVIIANVGGRQASAMWVFPNVDVHQERSLLAYMFARVGDPDAFLQKERGLTREIQLKSATIDRLRAELRDVQRQRAKAEWQLTRQNGHHQ